MALLARFLGPKTPFAMQIHAQRPPLPPPPPFPHPIKPRTSPSFVRSSSDRLFFAGLYPFSFHSASAGSAPDDVDWALVYMNVKWGRGREVSKLAITDECSVGTSSTRNEVLPAALFVFTDFSRYDEYFFSLELFSRLENNYYLFFSLSLCLSFFFFSALRKIFSERFESLWQFFVP